VGSLLTVLGALGGAVLALIVLALVWYVWHMRSGLARQRRRIAGKLAAIEAALAAGRDPDPEEVRVRAADPDARKVLYRRLASLGKEHLIPAEHRTRAAFAEADLVYWLSHPNELKEPPDEIELVEVVRLDGGPPLGAVEYYLFRFRTRAPHWAADNGWMAGVSGPYRPGDGIPPADPVGTFSEIRPMGEMSAHHHVAYFHGRIQKNGVYQLFVGQNVAADSRGIQRYFVRCRTPDGAETVERVRAPDASAALEMCRKRGFTDVELLMDEILSKGDMRNAEDELTPEQEVAMMTAGRWGGVGVIFRQTRIFWIPALLVVVYRVAMGEPLGWLGGAAVLVLLACSGLAIYVFLAAEPYRQLMSAISAGRWEEALRRLEKMEGSSKFAQSIPPAEFAFRRAQIYARLGKREQALAMARRGMEDPSQPAWHLELRMGDFHATALRDAAAALVHYRRAAELAPDNSIVHLSAAEFHAGHLARDPAAARAALEVARRCTLAASTRWAELKIEGMIAVEEGAHADAFDKLEQARAAVARLPDTGLTPLVDAYIGAYSCLALAALGRRDEARRHYATIENRLRPHDLDDLLERCRAAIG